MQRLQDRAIDQAVGEYLIVRAAKSAHLIAPPREVAATLAGMLAASGGAARARGVLGLTLAEARRAATIAVLNKLLVNLRQDRHWLERDLAQSTVVYYVGSRAGLSPAISPAGDPGHVAPDLAARDLAGHTVVLSSLRGHPVVLNIWAITCPGCDDDLGLLQRFAARHPTVRVVSLDEGDDVQAVRAFVSGLRVTYPIWLDSQSIAEDLYCTTGLPATYFIDERGIVRDMSIGPLVDAETLDQRAASILPAPALQAHAP
jgi:thiol-disulfide isomerase/thioredoxin